MIIDGVIMVQGGPDGSSEPRSWRRLPRLLLGSLRIVYGAAPREFTINTALQIVQGAATGVQLLVVRDLLSAVL
ncbi:MAG: hypothetical protein J2P44_08730, partial [Candidatus Dormibacteraeota bacterium]|nr:hypothetical protein [Candidatus Dormibacteraeota bacterium]